MYTITVQSVWEDAWLSYNYSVNSQTTPTKGLHHLDEKLATRVLFWLNRKRCSSERGLVHGDKLDTPWDSRLGLPTI